MTSSDAAPQPFRVAYVPGVTPTKWVRIWNERLPEIPLLLVPVDAAEGEQLLREGGADIGFLRQPVDRDYFSAIPLYTETTVAVFPKDHLFAAADELTCDDLTEETALHPLDDALGWDRPPGEPAFQRPETTADAIELVAAGIGVLAVPQSLARLHHRRDLTYRPLTDAPQSSIALTWPEAATTDRVDDFIGIVRGRTPNSTRGRRQPEQKAQPKKKPAPKKPAPRGARPQKPTGRRTGAAPKRGRRR